MVSHQGANHETYTGNAGGGHERSCKTRTFPKVGNDGGIYEGMGNDAQNSRSRAQCLKGEPLNNPTPDQVERLPKWAQEYIAGLQRELENSQRAITELQQDEPTQIYWTVGIRDE